MVLDLIPGTELLEPFLRERAPKVSVLKLTRRLQKASGSPHMGQWDQATALTPEEEGGSEPIPNDRRFNQSWPCREASRKNKNKNPKNGVQGTSRLVDTWGFGEDGALSVGAPHPFPPASPYAPLPAVCAWVISSYNKPVIQ